jgi:hypothetical protein
MCSLKAEHGMTGRDCPFLRIFELQNLWTRNDNSLWRIL